MKKLLLITGMLMIAFSLYSNAKDGDGDKTSKPVSKRTNTFVKPTNVVHQTLNGISEASADSMINDFAQNYYTKKTLPQLNFWFDIKAVKEMMSVINDDITSGKQVDGIRVYFVYNPKETSISILLVTTTGDGVVNDLHTDYYDHSGSDVLFSDPTRYEAIHLRGDADKGANLYNWRLFGFADDITCDFKDHPHYIKRHIGRKMVRAFGADSVNTKSEWYPTSIFTDIITDTKCNGMRMYFGRHPAKDPVDSIFDNRDCFVVVTTQSTNKKGKKNMDYFDCSTIQKTFQKKELYKFPLTQRAMDAGQDNGSLCPNNCYPPQ